MKCQISLLRKHKWSGSNNYNISDTLMELYYIGKGHNHIQGTRIETSYIPGQKLDLRKILDHRKVKVFQQ